MWEVHHFTTYTGTPSDHACLLQTKHGYHAVVTDGLGHWDPLEIGKVAAEVLNAVKLTSLQEHISSGV